jgi:alanine-glyoxylate transaminase/serine-glyoxylate transaminase/serine-pyruvate transaminase
MSQPAIGYLDPVFVEMMEELKSLLRYAYQTENPLTFRSRARDRWAWSTAS